MTQKLDPRRAAFRDDLADIELKEHIQASRYAEPTWYQVSAPVAPVRRHPRFDAPLDTQALYGQKVKVFDIKEGWAWGQLERDNYVGYIAEGMLAQADVKVTHKVIVPSTFVYPAPDIKTPPLYMLMLNSEVYEQSEDERFIKIADGGYIYKAHLAEKNVALHKNNYVFYAEQFLHTPYLWGGCSALGIDCSGLVQQSFHAAGLKAPRDSDMQEYELGVTVEDHHNFNDLQKGDLVFWQGHVGLMRDATYLIHANGYHMQTVCEPLHEAINRIADMYGTVTSVKRLDISSML